MWVYWVIVFGGHAVTNKWQFLKRTVPSFIWKSKILWNCNRVNSSNFLLLTNCRKLLTDFSTKTTYEQKTEKKIKYFEKCQKMIKENKTNRWNSFWHNPFLLGAPIQAISLYSSKSCAYVSEMNYFFLNDLDFFLIHTTLSDRIST